MIISFSYAQDDSLSVFRTNPNSSAKYGIRNTGFRNAIFIGLNHVGRGGISISYERFFNKPYISIYGGYGVSFIDYAGQYSFDADLFFYNPNDYSSISIERPGKIIDLGLKFLDVTVWDNVYLAFGYTFISNHLKRKINSEYEVQNNGDRTYQLDKKSNEIKLVLGFLNDDTRRFYFDASVGPGFRLLSFEELDITDDPFALYGLTQSNNPKEIGVAKVNKLEAKIWLFLGLKVGLRF
jgi:hypothetical protein